jgi:hypothetical protein
MLSNSSHPLMSFPLIELGLHKVHESIPCLASTSTSSVLSFIDYLQAMVIALHFAFELRSLIKLNYWFTRFCWFLWNSTVMCFLNLFLLKTRKGTLAKCKEQTKNMTVMFGVMWKQWTLWMISILFFGKHSAWVICNVVMKNANVSFLIVISTKLFKLTIFFLHFSKQTFCLGFPFCKIYSTPRFYVDTCVACMYYIVHK